MRKLAIIALVALVAFSGCSQFIQPNATPTPTPESPTETPDEPTPEPPDSTPTPNPSDSNDTQDDVTHPDFPTTHGQTAPSDFEDPSTDVIGWEDGYWYNEPVNVTTSDGLTEAEQSRVVARSQARVERLRGLEFNTTVPVDVISREEYQENYGHSTDHNTSFQNFDNAKFEALFLVGEDEDSLTVQENTRGSSVGGFYTPQNDKIVLVSDSDNPIVDEKTLIHELVHATQDQHFNLESHPTDTRDAYNARNGLIEGDAEVVTDMYTSRCGAEWNCVRPDGDSHSAPGDDFHWGIYLMSYFPYSDGRTFISHIGQRGGWDAVNAAYNDVPANSEEIIHPETYGQSSETVTLNDSNTDDWVRVSPRTRVNHASFGESAIFTMFANTLFDDTRESTVLRQPLREDNHHESNDLYNYNYTYSNGWGGDRMHIYKNTDSDELGYVWKLNWDTTVDASEFNQHYRLLLDYYGAEQAGDSENIYTIDSGPYADSFYVVQEGRTVYIVNAPSVGELAEVSEISAAGATTAN